MKTMILSLIAATVLCLPAQSQQRIVTERDSLGHTTRIIEVLDTVRDGRAETDTLSITTYEEPTERTFTGHSVDYQWKTNLTDKDLAHIVSWAKQARLRRLYELNKLEATLARTKDAKFANILSAQIKLLRAEIYDLETKYIKIIGVDTPEILGRLPQ